MIDESDYHGSSNCDPRSPTHNSPDIKDEVLLREWLCNMLNIFGVGFLKCLNYYLENKSIYTIPKWKHNLLGIVKQIQTSSLRHLLEIISAFGKQCAEVNKPI